MTQEEKQQAHGLLAERFDEQQLSVFRIEERLGMYMQGLVNNPEYHNAYEILGALKFLRMLRTYEQDIKTFRDVIYKYEGVWEQRDGIWHHGGRLKHPGTGTDILPAATLPGVRARVDVPAEGAHQYRSRSG